MKLHTVNEREQQRRDAVAARTATPAPPPPRSVVNAYTMSADPVALAALVPSLRDCRATAVVDAAERYQRAADAVARLNRRATTAPGRLDAALAEHHQAVTAAIADGRAPDTAATWAAVIAAREDVECCRDSAEPARRGLELAVSRLHAELGRAWPLVLPWIAKQRARRGNDPTLSALAFTITWPALHVGPGTEGMNTEPTVHFKAWWPLSITPMERGTNRPERIAWNEWAWAQLAEHLFDVDDDGRTISFQTDWQVPEANRFDGSAAGAPVVEVSAAVVDRYAAERAANR